MIQALQKFSQSRTAKIFLGLVALSFILFFGGGNFFQPRDPYAVIAEVGGLSIGRNEFLQKVQLQVQQIMAKTGKSLTREEILNEGIPQVILEQLVQENLLNLETKNLGLTVSDEKIKNQIHSMPAFQDANGLFNRGLFTNALRGIGLAEDTFIEEIRKDLIREQLVEAIAAGVSLPEGMVGPLFDATFQSRQASVIVVSPKDIVPPPPPSDEELKAFYEKFQEDFKTPELRTITALVIDPSAMASAQDVTEEEAKEVYDSKPDEYGKQTFKEVKPKIIAELKREKALDKAFQISQELDDKVAGGETLEEIKIADTGVQRILLGGIDAKGYNRMKVKAPELPKNPDLANEMLQTAFSLEEGMDNPFTQTKSGEYFMVRVDKITPTRVQPFDEIKDLVLKTWTDFKKLEGAQKKAKQYADTLNKGGKVPGMKMLPPLSISDSKASNVSDRIKEAVLTIPKGLAGVEFTPEGFAVIRVDKVIPPTAMVKEEKRAQFEKILLKAYKEDYVIGYLNALRIRYPVKYNRKAINALFSDKG